MDCGVLFMAVANGRAAGGAYTANSEVRRIELLSQINLVQKTQIFKYSGGSFVSVQQFSTTGISRFKFVSFNYTLSQVRAL